MPVQPIQLHRPHQPSTRFQGSKHKLLNWLWQHFEPLKFQTCLDAFSGSGCVSHFLKRQGKSVTSNDILISSTQTAMALVENDVVQLSESDVDLLITRRRKTSYDDFIARTFDDIYFTAEENTWLDIVAQNIAKLDCRYKQAIARHALFQAALAKRPYNLFHRRNLYMRLASVDRTFGNKTTWDKPFGQHFRRFVASTNAAIHKSAPCHAINGDAINVAGEFDLIYIDPPYLNRAGIGVDYHGFYHFLEGLTDYANWPAQVDYSSKHRRIYAVPNRWTNKATIHKAFADLVDRYRNSILAISYRSDGIPTVEELSRILRSVKRHVSIHTLSHGYKYALSTNGKSSETLLIGQN